MFLFQVLAAAPRVLEGNGWKAQIDFAKKTVELELAYSKDGGMQTVRINASSFISNPQAYMSAEWLLSGGRNVPIWDKGQMRRLLGNPWLVCTSVEALAEKMYALAAGGAYEEWKKIGVEEAKADFKGISSFGGQAGRYGIVARARREEAHEKSGKADNLRIWENDARAAGDVAGSAKFGEEAAGLEKQAVELGKEAVSLERAAFRAFEGTDASRVLREALAGVAHMVVEEGVRNGELREVQVGGRAFFLHKDVKAELRTGKPDELPEQEYLRLRLEQGLPASLSAEERREVAGALALELAGNREVAQMQPLADKPAEAPKVEVKKTINVEMFGKTYALDLEEVAEKVRSERIEQAEKGNAGTFGYREAAEYYFKKLNLSEGVDPGLHDTVIRLLEARIATSLREHGTVKKGRKEFGIPKGLRENYEKWIDEATVLLVDISRFK
ncbi:hypothetical protein HY992_00800 [Candidatus Micrarchaeota archaeon]|nr:hypothetical protein [Candidatus Micrarchaeota archaeon]